MSKPPQTISETIRETIATRGLTAYALAKLSGASVDSIQRFLNRERDMSLTNADKVATALGLVLSCADGTPPR
jgi:plasmid maintenance system antidote protein VapI